MVDFEDLTDQQRRAADALDRNVTLTAGAGTGKTTTLTQRYVRMLERGLEATSSSDDSSGDEPPADDPSLLHPEEILTTTFTERAANELKQAVREEITERVADADAETYARWREVADGLEDGYVHTLHGFCARLLREHALTASTVEPGFDTLDEHETTALLEDTVATLLETHDDHEAVRTLSRRFDRRGLQAVLSDLLTERPGCLEWAERWADATEDEYLAFVDETLHPVSPDLAAERLGDPRFVDAVEELRSLVELPPAPVDTGGKAWDRAVGVVDRLDGLELADVDAEGEPTAEVRDCFVDLCDHLTTGSGERYASYAGANNRWDGAENAKADFDAAMAAVVDVLEPEAHLVSASVEVDRNSVPFVRALAELALLANEAYAERKRRENVVDFTDQIEFALRFLREDASGELRRELRERFAYVLVDEFQDTDPRQWDLVKHLTAEDPGDFDAENVFLVGDAKQSIYRFRNADVTQFGATAAELDRANRSRATDGGPDAEAEAGVAVPESATADDELTTNFRTLPGVLDAVNELFEKVFEVDGPAYESAPQRLDADRDDPDGLADVEYLAVPTDADYRRRRFADDHEFATARVEHESELEGQALAARLTQLFDEPAGIYDPDSDPDEPEPRDVRPDDVAILLRSRTHLKTYERALEAAGVPFTVASGLGFYETPEVTALVNLLRALADSSDERALYGALRSPLFGITDDTLALLKRDGEPLWDALGDADAAELADAHDRLVEWRAAAGLGPDSEPRLGGSWAAFLSRVVDETGYLASVSADERPRQAVANVEKFREQLRGFSEDGVTSLPTLVDRIERRRDIGTREGEATVRGGGDGVQILTVHDAKGMEFPVVVVPGVGKAFNTKAAVGDGRVEFESVDGEYAVGLKAPDPDDGFDLTSTVAREALKERRVAEERAEEKRVLYVACTRARDRLLLTGVHDLDTDAGSDATLADVEDADPDEPRSWRDWVQPHLLDEDALEALEERDSVTTRLGDASVTVSLPTPAADWADETAVPEPDVELSPTPPEPERRFSLSPTDLVSLFDGRGSLRADEWTNTVSYEEADAAETDVAPVDEEPADDGGEAATGSGESDSGESDSGESDSGESAEADGSPVDADATVFGTMVHRLCELRPPDDRRDEVMARTFEAEDGEGELTAADRERVREHAERAIEFVDELHESYDVEYAYDELRVTAAFDRGEVSGLVDHLIVTPDTYYVVDYKTNDVAADEVKDEAEQYRPQLEAYAVALHEQDPERQVQGVLYFTAPGEAHRSRWIPAKLDDLAADLEGRVEDAMEAVEEG